MNSYTGMKSRAIVSSVLLTSLMVLAVFAILTLSIAHAQTSQYTSNIGFESFQVNNTQEFGSPIYGYYVALIQNGQVINSCYTECGFTIQNGVEYQAQIDNYGNECFAYWITGSTSNVINIDFGGASSASQVQAFYKPCNGGGGSSSGTSQLTVASQDTSGNAIHGYYTILYNSGGSAVATGFTPKTFTLTNGASYSVQVDNYGSCNFAKWSDGQTANPRPVSITSATTLTAIYNCGGSSGTGSTVNLHVYSENYHANTVITGYYVVLYQDGKVVATGFTPTSFHLIQGQTYTIQADSYGSCQIDHWIGVPGQPATGIPNPVTFVASSSDVGFTAEYICSGS
jgi:hypothetical protein